MTQSKLGRLLDLFYEVDGPLSLGYIAFQLGVSPQMAENMIQFWIQRGKIQPGSEPLNCGICTANQACPFIFQLPTSYQLAEVDRDSES